MGKYSHLRLPMRIAGSPDIVQAKMSKLMVVLDFKRTYLYDFSMHHQGKPGSPPKTFKVGTNQVAKSGLASQCP